MSAEVESNALLIHAVAALGYPLCVVDEHGTVVAVNQAWRDFSDCNGGAAHHYIGQNYLTQCDAAPPGMAHETNALSDGIRAVLRGDLLHFSYDYPCHSPTEQRWFSARVHRLPWPKPYVAVAHIDVTELHRNLLQQAVQQNKLRHLQRLYAAINEANQIIGTSNDLQKLFAEVCRIAVDLGGMQMAWVAQPDASGDLLVPMASYGTGRDYLDGIGISTRADVPEGRGPTGTAFRENRTAINQADHPEFDMSAWRERFAAFNWQSSATFPVRQEGRVFAVLTVYSTESNAFDAPVVALLETLAANLGQAAHTIAQRAQQQALEEQVRRSEEMFRTLFETVHQGVVFQDTQGIILSANPAAERILGLSLAQMTGRTSIDPRWGSIKPDGSPFLGNEHPAMRALASGQPVIGVVMGVVHPDKTEPVWIQINATPVHNKTTGALEYVYSIFDDISESMRLQKELQFQANRDFLTEAANRRHFFALGQHELTRAARYASDTSLLMLDIDHFKAVNDTYGHAAGDVVLKMLARVCKESLREVDVLGRIGGEEFAILLPQTPQAMAFDVAERVRVAVQNTRMDAGPNAQGIQVTVSIGVASCTGQATLDDMLKSADAALYQAKHSGRNKVCIDAQAP